MQIVYRVDGSHRLSEQELGGLPGYQGATPVRIGNAASGQTQLDVFGELMDSFDVLAKAGIERTPRIVEVEIAIVEHLEKVWDQPSADIWESRGDRQCYTYSQVMAWVGVTRFLAAHGNNAQVDRALIARLEELSEVIHRTVCGRGYSSDLGHFVQHYGGDTLDASLLLLPLVGFLSVADPRIASTIAAIERDLMEGGLVRRKPPKPDGRDEGAFLACSCWLADCYKMQGRNDEAAALLERVIGVSNDVGLLSEEYDVRGRCLIGNIPQALTHLGLINTALFLSGPVIHRAGG
jgi:GH15 family glucan-1,4-alpha-glucosidase